MLIRDQSHTPSPCDWTRVTRGERAADSAVSFFFCGVSANDMVSFSFFAWFPFFVFLGFFLSISFHFFRFFNTYFFSCHYCKKI